jgi:DNA repair protein RadA/Sms
MARVRQVYACASCGAVQSKWMGKCPDCGAWDSLAPELIEPKARTDPRRDTQTAWSRGRGEPDGAPSNPARRASELNDSRAHRPPRIRSGIDELDRVLGGGFVPGSAVLLGGDPGIGKSTLLLQAAVSLARSGHRALYVSSEESAQQIAMRAERVLGGGPPAPPGGPGGLPAELFMLSETSLARILEQASRVLGDREPSDPDARAPLMVIDSVQMIYKADLDAFPGSLTQLRRCCAELVYFAKATGVCVVLVGHVTKEGLLAGPRLLEHLVDAVLSFEGDRYHAHRIVRAVKNRFGSTLELGLFEMTGHGLRQAPDGASVAALAGSAGRPGTIVCPVLTGTRCLLVEVQALTATGFLGAAKRKCSGLDPNRLAMLIAVLEQHAGLRLADRDIFASATAGVRVAEPAADLAVLLAIAGAHHRRSLPATTAVVGEVGLAGEIRGVPQLESRLLEAARLGYTELIVPKGTDRVVQPDRQRGAVALFPVSQIDQAIQRLM